MTTDDITYIAFDENHFYANGTTEEAAMDAARDFLGTIIAEDEIAPAMESIHVERVVLFDTRCDIPDEEEKDLVFTGDIEIDGHTYGAAVRA